MPYISATELIMYAPCFLRLAIVLTIHRIDQVRQSVMRDLALQLHSVTFRHPPRRHVLRPDQRNDFIGAEGVERQSHAGARGLGRVAVSPLIAAKVVADFQPRLALHILLDNAAVSDDIVTALQRNRKQPIAVLAIAPQVALDPVHGVATVKGLRVILHGDIIANDGKDRVHIVAAKSAQRQPLGLQHQFTRRGLNLCSHSGCRLTCFPRVTSYQITDVSLLMTYYLSLIA